MQIEPGSLKCSQRNKRPRLLSGLLFALAVSTGYGQYYFDQFTRESDPAPVTPWIVQSGAWTVTGGSALGAGTQNLSYATAYITNTLGEYSVEARLRFPAGAYGGGISGRLSPETGARYAAWIYPDGSPGGGNTLKLIKFNTWTTFGYSNVTSLPMRQVALPSVGTDWHTVKLQFQTNHITIFYDGTEVISMNDLNGPVFASGSVSLDLWRNQTAYDMMVDDVAVIAAPPIANADSYVVLAGGSLTVATPGVLANDTGGAGDLTAALVDGPSHGSLTLQADGGFVYTPEPEFVGADSFSYLAGDGTSNSAPVLVNLAINQNHAPAAVDDAYTVTANTTLAVVAPGVLGNDNDPENLPLTAVLVSGTTNGTVILDPNGGFSYSPVFGFVGTDAFTYRASDGSISSLVATASIAVMPGGRWFVDNFDRTLEPGPITPWISRAGSWAVSEGVLLAGTNAPLTYAWAYLTNSWTNYTVQARVRFPAGAFGGALSGCLDMATGSRYSAWIYPAGSSGGPNVLKLVKFKTWTTFNYQGITGATIAQVPLAPVGTDWHSLKLAFLGSRIGVYYDGEMVLSVSDLEAQPYPGGSVSLDLWTDPAGYQMAFDDVLVDPLVGDDQYGVSGGATLVVPPPGVLVNDTGVFGTNLAAVLVSAPATGALTLNSNGGFVFEPPAGFDGVTTFQYRVDEGSSNSLTGTVTLLINDAADPPTLPVQPDFLVDELITLVITNTGADPDLPADALSYVLTSALPGAVINGNGVITWTPSEADGPGTNWLTTVVSDQSNPPLRATNVIQVVVREVNAPPVIPTTPDQVVSELTEMVITHLAADGDLPANQVSYVLEEAPAGAVMDAQGVFRWLPTEEQGPSTNVVSIVALDDGTPPMSATNRFTVVVTEANQAPSLPVLPDLTIDELTPLQVINAAADLDLPAQGLNYELALGPAGAAIDQQGTITWQPSEAQGPSTNVFATIVTDGVGGSSFATNSFTVIVKEVNEGPVLPSVSEVTLTEMSPLWVTNAAVDIDQPANALSYTLIEAPEGAVIDNSGLIHWVPTENHGPGTSLFVTVVTDDAESPLSATNSFLVHVVETNAYPVLPVQVDRSIIVTESITITNTAADPDVPENTLQYALSIAPAGAGISADGVISWVAGPGNENTTNVFETVVTDSGTPPLSATNRFSVVVLPRPAFLVDTMVLSAESCVPSNGGIDPGETVTIGISFKNPGPGDVANLVVELQATTNVLATSEPQVFGPVPDSASTGAQPFTFTASGSCGGSLTLRFNVYDGEVSLGTTVVNWGMGQEQTVLSETFDSVAAPDLPTGWSTAASGSHPVWNVAAGPGESAPNAVFSPGASDAGVSELVTPEIVLAGTSPELVFAQNYDLEADGAVGYDGGVLEIKLGNNAFVDVLAAGAVFTAGGYNTILDSNYGNPLGGRAAWSGNSGGYVMTVLRLPQTAAGQTVQLRWRSASDAASNQAGWWIDTVNLKSRVCCENAAPVLGVQPDMAGTELALLQVTNSVVFAGSPPGPFGYALLNPPTGASIDAQGVITWVPAENQGPGTYVVTTVVVNESAPHLKATNTFQVTVEEANSAPVLPVLADTSIPEAIELVITNTALDLDLPANTLAYQLSQAPAGAVIGADGVIRWTPGEFDGGGTFSFTTVVTDEGMPAQSSTNSFVVTVEEVNSAPILPKLPNRTVVITTELIVTNAGVDPDFPANALAYILETGPAGATIDPQGVIFWTPSEQTGTGVYAFTTVVVDDGVPAMSATNTFAVTVIDTNLPPVLPVHEPLSIVETSQLTITNTATDPDGSAGALVYTLLAAPAGALIDTSGIISWQPGEEQGPSEHAFITKVTDAGVPPRSATNQFVVTVLESNLPPVLPVQTNLTVAEHALVVLTNSAADTDLPSNTLTYVLETAPGGAVIDAHGVITWEAAEEHGPGTHVFTTVVIDNGSPALTATNSFTVTVTEINEAPVLPAQPGRVVAEMSRMWVTNTAADPDLPANALVYNLQSAPAGASIDGEGVISWEPTEQQGPGVHTFVIVVLDERGLSATNAFEVTVVESNQPPLMPVQSDRTVLEMTQVMITNTATDLDEPKNGVRYVLQSGPAGASIDLNGVLSWEPAEFQGPGVHTFTLVAVDNGEPALSTTNTFTITVLESNRAPVLPFQPDLVVEELATMQVTNRAVDFDLPLNLLTYALVQAPPGALLSPNGIITWTPAAGQGGSTNEFMLVVTDSGGPSMSATNSFLVVVPGTAQSLEITGFQITGGTASLSWNSAIGQTYRVQYCNPLGGTWQDASADLGADQAVTTVTIPISNPSGFYRVIKLEAGSAPAMGAQFSN